ncbi:MAG: hypothetical protein JWM36_1007 [Hyphomicrobiales bacterium]|nr:hypothetical protein [Hyphomicrobiales bacterium]
MRLMPARASATIRKTASWLVVKVQARAGDSGPETASRRLRSIEAPRSGETCARRLGGKNDCPSLSGLHAFAPGIE